MSADFATVTPGDGSTGASDAKLASVPQVAALLGMAVLDAMRASTLEVTIHGGDQLQLIGTCLYVRPALLALLRNLGV